MKRGRPKKKISMEDMDLLRWRFVNERTYTDIAGQEGITRQAVMQKIQRAVLKMAEAVHVS